MITPERTRVSGKENRTLAADKGREGRGGASGLVGSTTKYVRWMKALVILSIDSIDAAIIRNYVFFQFHKCVE